MIVTIQFEDQTAHALAAQAALRHVSIETYLAELAKAQLNKTAGGAASGLLGRMDVRTLRNLPHAERDHLLACAADTVAHDYEPGGKLAGFSALGENDHSDSPLGE